MIELLSARIPRVPGGARALTVQTTDDMEADSERRTDHKMVGKRVCRLHDGIDDPHAARDGTVTAWHPADGLCDAVFVIRWDDGTEGQMLKHELQLCLGTADLGRRSSAAVADIADDQPRVSYVLPHQEMVFNHNAVGTRVSRSTSREGTVVAWQADDTFIVHWDGGRELTVL